MRILFIEDDSDFREVMSEVLTEEGHHVVSAADGVTGYQRLLEMKPMPDALIVDEGIPGLSGTQLIRKIRSEQGERFASLPILLMSGARDLGKIADEMDLKFFLKKPPSLDEVFQTLEAMSESRTETVL